MRIVIAEDHNLVRAGIRALLEESGRVEVVGEACNGLEAVTLAEELAPDLLIMDISMPQLDGIQATERINKLGLPTRIIVLSMYSKPSIVQQVLRRGAKGYLIKSAISEELLLAIDAASRGHIYLSPSISGCLLENLWALQDQTAKSGPADQLTPRERQVLQLISEGHTNNDIAENLVVSPKTVDKHRMNLMSKLGVHDLSSLMREALKHNLIFWD